MRKWKKKLQRSTFSQKQVEMKGGGYSIDRVPEYPVKRGRNQLLADSVTKKMCKTGIFPPNFWLTSKKRKKTLSRWKIFYLLLPPPPGRKIGKFLKIDGCMSKKKSFSVSKSSALDLPVSWLPAAPRFLLLKLLWKFDSNLARNKLFLLKKRAKFSLHDTSRIENWKFFASFSTILLNITYLLIFQLLVIQSPCLGLNFFLRLLFNQVFGLANLERICIHWWISKTHIFTKIEKNIFGSA